MDENVMLRCKYCGAPFEPETLGSDSQIVTCTSCGTSQQRVDARAYLDQLMTQVQSWISSAIPTGFNMSQADNVDAVARHSIFMRNIQPRIENGLMEYRFCNNSLLANPLLVLPFMTMNIRAPSKSSAQAFEFNASVKSVSALAVDDASTSLVNEAAAVSQIYALMMNNTRLMAEDKEGRYILMSNNFSETSRLLKGMKGYEPIYERFTALAKVCDGISRIMEGDIVNAASMVKEGVAMLESVKTTVMSNAQYSIMYQAAEQELSIANAVDKLIDMINDSQTMDPLKTVEMIQKVMKRGIINTGAWTGTATNTYRYTEVFDEMTKVFDAKMGKSTIRVAAGGGDWLMPFWVIDMEFSMAAGGFLSKKSMEIAETILAPAEFVCDGSVVNQPQGGLTDVFSLRTGPKDDGSVSEREGVKKLVATVQDGSAGTRSVVLPMSTKKEAAKLGSEYLNQRMRADSKMRLGKPRVKELIYVPCTLNGDSFSLPAEFGRLRPLTVDRMSRNTVTYV